MAAFLDYIHEIQRKGSTRAFYQLVQLFEHKVFTLCYRIIGNREEAEEAAQDVFMNCYRNLRQLDDPNKFPQWLLRIAYSKSIDYVRRKKVSKLGLEEVRTLAGDVNQRAAEGDLSHSEILEKALQALAPSDSALIFFYYQEAMSIKEIAALTELSESNVKVRLHRARAEIRKVLELKIKDTNKNQKPS